MASVWIEKRQQKHGMRYRVLYRLSGEHHGRHRYAGSFLTEREAEIRKQWVREELAAMRVPDIRTYRQPEVEEKIVSFEKRGEGKSLLDVVGALRKGEENGRAAGADST